MIRTRLLEWAGLPEEKPEKKSALPEVIEDLKIISNPKHFPNFNKLAIHICNDEIIRKVFEYLPNLDTLSFTDFVLDGLRITDLGITGIRSIQDQRVSYDPEIDLSRKAPKRTWPYIGNCKELTYFYLRVTGGDASEKSVLYGILDLKKLENLLLVGIKLSPGLLALLKHRGFECEKHINVESKDSYEFKRTFEKKEEQDSSKPETKTN